MKRETNLRAFWKVLVSEKLGCIGILIYLFFLLVAFLAPYIAPYSPEQIIMEGGEWMQNRPPSAQFWFGTTNMGRDIFSQLVYGSRMALLVGFTAAFFVMIIGTVIGLLSGYYGGWIDDLLMRTADVAFGIPFLPFVIILVSFLGLSTWNIVIAMALLLWRNTARVIRAQVLTLKERPFIESAKIAGASHSRIIFVHLAPNIFPLSFLYGALAVGWAILTEASVSFLGFGDPTVITWGKMLQEAYAMQAMSRGAYHWFIPPGICIMLTVMAGFFISRGYEETLYPKLRKQRYDAA